MEALDEEKARHESDKGEEIGEEEEKDAFLPQVQPPPEKARPPGLSRRYCFSVAVNTGSAVGLVFANKRIFEDEALRHAQVTFAALHFAITAATLYAVSAPAINMFQRKEVGALKIMPLAIAMILSVVLTNASLAYSSIQFYQVARVLVTPCVAAVDFLMLKKRIPVPAAMTLIPVCVGVGVVSYFDTSSDASNARGTSPLGVFFAMISLMATATYTVLIKKYHETTGCESAQLLLNQSPVSVLVMLYIIPFSDDITVWNTVSAETWAIILLSGVLACLLHISQFLIIDGAGPVSSTVVGHLKTCVIIAIGSAYSGKPLADGSMIGILLAIGGIIAYSVVNIKMQKR